MSKLGRSWRAFWGLSWAERWILARTLLLLPLTVVSLHLLGFGRTQALLLPASGSASARTDPPMAESFARIVHGAAPWSLLPANCLPRALVLCRLLRRRGLQAELRLGVGKPEGHFAAHAWVEHAGSALAEPEGNSERFSPLGGTSLTDRN
jgi:hypothetical protein